MGSTGKTTGNDTSRNISAMGSGYTVQSNGDEVYFEDYDDALRFAKIDSMTAEYIRSHFKEALETAMPDTPTNGTEYSYADYGNIYNITGKLGWGFNEKDLNNIGKAVMGGSDKVYWGAQEMLTDSNFHTGSRLLDQAHEAVANGTPKKQAYQPYFDYVKQEFANR